MKKIVVTVFLFILIVLLNITSSFAQDAKAELVIDKTSFNKGDTFTVTLRANCDEGLSFVGAELEFDKDIFSLQDEKVAEDWVNYGKDKLELLINSSEKVTSLDACKWTFKVNDNAKDAVTNIVAKNLTIVDIKNNETKLDTVEKKITIGKGSSNYFVYIICGIVLIILFMFIKVRKTNNRKRKVKRNG